MTDTQFNNGPFDREARIAKVDARLAEKLRAGRAESEVLRVLPDATPDCLALVYTHGLDKPLYGASLGLKFDVIRREQAAEIAALFPPDAVELVSWGSPSPGTAYRSFWPAHYDGEKEQKKGGILSREPLAVPAWYKCDSYGGGNLAHKVGWYWTTELPTLGRRTLAVNCEIAQDGGRFTRTPGGYVSPWGQVKGGRGSGPKTAYPYKPSLPDGCFKGRYGNFVGDLDPYVEVYWPEEQYGQRAAEFGGDIPALLRDALRDAGEEV